jgi:hypothetical protein
MQKTEMTIAFAIAVISIAAGFLLFRHLFDLNTLKLKPRFHGTSQRSRQWFRAHARKIILIIMAAIAAAVLLFAAIRFAGPIVKAIDTLISRLAAPKPDSQIAPPAVAEPAPNLTTAIVADHRVVDEVRLDLFTPSSVEQAKAVLHIFLAYGTHGSQISYGLKGLPTFKGPLFNGLDIESLELADRSEPDLQGWTERARSYLADPANRDTNVVMWFWTDELSSATEQTVIDYLQLTGDLEEEHPGVRFVYTTGHLDGSGPTGNLHQRNEQIRTYCLEYGKILYDFADIESYDPDGNYYGDKSVNDGCWYDSDANGSLDRNWAKEWSEANPGKWYDCFAAHSFPLNANLKAYAAWWLFARLAEENTSGESN